MHMEIRYLIIILSAILIFGGLYFKFVYDVPDGQEITNIWVSLILVILGVSGIIISSLWRKKNPLEIKKEDLSDDNRDEIGRSDIKDRSGRNSKDTSDDGNYHGARSVDT